MILDKFDRRTLVHMEVALDRICRDRPNGDSHAFRRSVAESIVRCAASGRTAVGQLMEAGERSLTHVRPERQSA